jgi:hypothetical protein
MKKAVTMIQIENPWHGEEGAKCQIGYLGFLVTEVMVVLRYSEMVLLRLRFR